MTQYTPNLNLPYPGLQDTADVPRDIQALAVKLDALLGGGSGGGGTATLPLAAAPVLDVGLAGQIRAGRQLSAADFTALGLSPPLGLWSLSDLTNQGSDGRPLVNLGAVPFSVGINGLASTCAQFAGSTAQALYIVDSGAADPYRINTGSWGCWFRSAKRGTSQTGFSKFGAGATRAWWLNIPDATNVVVAGITFDGSTAVNLAGVTDCADDRWHFAVATFDGTAFSIYVDGVREGASLVAGMIFAGASAPVNVGAYGANASTAATSPHYGRVDEAFVTADVLTDDQVRLLYATRLAHTLGTIPSSARLKVHRRRRGSAFAVADFPTQPVRLHNFTGGALTDQGSGAVALTNNGAAVPVAGADGTPAGAFNFVAASSQSLSSTDAGLPGALTARSYGCWFKAATTSMALLAWGTTSATNDARIGIASAGGIYSGSGADSAVGPYCADGLWHFVVATEDNAAGDGVKRKLYYDGRCVAGSTVLNAITLGGANHFRVGADCGGASFATAQIDGAFVCGYALTSAQVIALYARGAEDLGGSPKNAGDHVERLDAASVLFIGDTLDPQHTVDLGVVA